MASRRGMRRKFKIEQRPSQRKLALRLILNAIENCHTWLEERDPDQINDCTEFVWVTLEPFEDLLTLCGPILANEMDSCDGFYQYLELLHEAVERLDQTPDQGFSYIGSSTYSGLIRRVSKIEPLGGGYWLLADETETDSQPAT